MIKTLESMAEVFGERNASLGREITKMYEETLRGTLSEIVTTLKSRDNLKGEFTLVIEGNSQDKGRALNILKQVDLIACEDTRTTKKLLSRYQIQKPLTSYHEHNEIEKSKRTSFYASGGS